MKIHLNWDTEDKKLLLITYEKGWQWEEFDQVALQLDKLLLNISPHMIDLIIDIQHAGIPPLGSVNKFKAVVSKRHDNIGEIVFVLSSFQASFLHNLIKLVRFSMTSIGQTFSMPDFAFFSDIGLAKCYLASQRLAKDAKPATQ